VTFEQAAIIILLAGLLVVFALDRWRMEIVALAGLGIAALLGLVPVRDVFSGFANPAVITVVEILLIVQVLARTRLLDDLAKHILRLAGSQTLTVAAMAAASALLSVIMNNIGALALMIPVATSICRTTGIPPRRVMMPIAFAALLGGLCSVVGTPANLIASQQLQAATGRGFGFFDFAWAGIPAAIAGLIAIVIWMPRAFRGDAAEGELRPAAQKVVAELEVSPASTLAGQPLSGFTIALHAVSRDGAHLFMARGDTPVQPGDLLLVEATLDEIETAVKAGDLHWPRAGKAVAGERTEAVIMPESTLVGSRIATAEPFSRRGVRILAVSARTPRLEGGFGDVRLSIGDILHLEGDAEAIAEALAETEALALGRLPSSPPPLETRLPLGFFMLGVALAATGIVPPEIAFGLVVLALAASGYLNLRSGLADLNWPILIMLAAMIPLGLAVETTGTAQMLAAGLTTALPSDMALMPVAVVLLLAVLITPFVNNASTAIVLGPVAIGIAQMAGIPPEPVLLAAAMGASIDFLTPFGHHNNMVVMGLGPYRFADYLRAGWPVTLAAAGAGLAAIWAFWI
jgi:di/tricarboxylate transporter